MNQIIDFRNYADGLVKRLPEIKKNLKNICHIDLLDYRACFFDFLLSLALWWDISAVSVLLQCEYMNVLQIRDIWVNGDIFRVNPRPGGGLSHLRPGGGGSFWPRDLTQKLRRIERRGKKRSIALNEYNRKCFTHFFRSGQY